MLTYKRNGNVRRAWKRVCHEPSFHFVILATGLFWLASYFPGKAHSLEERIVISVGQVDRARNLFQATHLRLPSKLELQEMVNREIKTQVYYREAVAMGLDQADEIIERRLEEKLRFVSQDVADDHVPSDQELQAYLNQYSSSFMTESKISFIQYYLDPALHVDIDMEVAGLLTRLTGAPKNNNIEAGDALPIPRSFSQVSGSEVAACFGSSFAGTLQAVPVGKWTGPVISGLGRHVVLVQNRTAGRRQTLDEAREGVLREWRNARRTGLNDQAYQRMLRKYKVFIEVPGLDADSRTGVESQ